MAKKFFYVCAGLFLLAGAYATGARSAHGAGGSVPIAIRGAHFTASSDGRISEFQGGANPWVHVGTAPSAISAFDEQGSLIFVVTDTGDVYSSSDRGSSWPVYWGNIFGGPTPATHESFGGIKARYR